MTHKRIGIGLTPALHWVEMFNRIWINNAWMGRRTLGRIFYWEFWNLVLELEDVATYKYNIYLRLGFNDIKP